MAPSRLYENALSSLGAARAQWDAAAQRIAAVNGPDSRNQSGQDTVRSIEAEEQLSADPDAAEPSILAQALAVLASMAWPDGPSEFPAAYEEALDQFRLKGTRIQSSPAMLFRYANGPGLLRVIARALADAGQDHLAGSLNNLIDSASGKAPTHTWDVVVAYVRKSEVWTLLVRNHVPLSRPGRSMFVTFDLASPRDRQSAQWLHAALALWLDRDPCFLEVSFPTATDDELLFPTFADAGWFRHFRGAPAAEPHGWTRPHPPRDPVADRQPEAVMETQGLDRLPSPSHLRAVPP